MLDGSSLHSHFPFTPLPFICFFQNALNMLHRSESVLKSWQKVSCGFVPWVMTASLPTSPRDRRFGIPG